MTNRIAFSRGTLLLAGVFALGHFTSGGVGRFIQSLEPAAHAEPAGGCDAGSLHGKYGFSFTGDAEGAGSLGGLGVETCDGHGTCTGNLTVATEGSPQPLTFVVHYTINPDCTGAAVVDFSDAEVSDTAMVVLDDGKEFRFISTSPGTTLVANAKRL